MGSLASLSRFVRTSAVAGGAFHYRPAYVPSRGRPEPRQLPFLRRPIGVSARSGVQECPLLCIGYAFRPRLSSRLTLGGLALPRKPWVYGGGVFHAALVTHASILTSGRSTAGCPDGFAADGKLPYH